jgi:competence protein ComEC
MLDVGQGAASVIETKNHVVVFDTGARFSDRLDTGKSVVIPYLRAQAIDKVDRLIISHGDADHIGGAEAILNGYPETELFGQDISRLTAGDSSPAPIANNERICTAGQRWVWDEVVFQILSPGISDEVDTKVPASKPGSIKRNNRSCVLRVSSRAGSVLFTGDIEKGVERTLVEKYASTSATLLAADILMVPHHGSNTSSSRSFIEAVNPEIALISVGYKNRYRLPSRKVVARYQRHGAELYDSAASGAVSITLREGGVMDVTRFRHQARRYWHHIIPN